MQDYNIAAGADGKSHQELLREKESSGNIAAAAVAEADKFDSYHHSYWHNQYRSRKGSLLLLVR